MSKVEFSNLVEDFSADLDGDEAAGFLEEWHRWAGDERIEVFLLPAGKAVFMSLNDVTHALRTDLEGLVWFGGGEAQNVYFGVSSVPEEAWRGFGRGRRGAAGARGACGGAWLDVDVKDGVGLGSWDEVMGFVRRLDDLGVGPSSVVATGSGGAHLYFGVEGGVDSGVGVELSQRLRLWARTVGVVLDNVAQRNRVMRLPGTVRVGGKKADPWIGTPVSLVRSGGPWLDVEKLREVTAEVWESVRREVVRVESEIFAEEKALSARLAGAMPGGSGSSKWKRALLVDGFEEEFARAVSWAQILEGAGWTRFGEPDGEGRVTWTRPGGGAKNPRSAITDWEGSPDVMSLLSDSPDTGLRRLYLANEFSSGRRRVALTKARVAAELWFSGSFERLVEYWMSKK